MEGNYVSLKTVFHASTGTIFTERNIIKDYAPHVCVVCVIYIL